MKNTLAILLTAVVGFSAATVVFAQQAAAPAEEMANTEMNEAMNEVTNEAENAMPVEEAAPAVNTEAPSAPSAY